MTIRRRAFAARFLGAGATAALLAGALAAPAGAARPSGGGPSITVPVIDGNCQMSMTYSATGGKVGEVDLLAMTWGYNPPSAPTAGYDYFAGSTWLPVTMSHGKATVVFQLAPGGRLKQFTYNGWLYGKAVGTLKPGTETPYYTLLSTCVMPDFQYTVKFHDGYTSGDAGFIAADQQRVTFGSLIAEPPAPTRADYVFTGWKAYDYGYLGPNPAGFWNFNTDTMRDYDPLVMYAQWEPACPPVGCAVPG